ncbi:unnamed protein product, partial [Schistosoma turkestanicum]
YTSSLPKISDNSTIPILNEILSSNLHLSPSVSSSSTPPAPPSITSTTFSSSS